MSDPAPLARWIRRTTHSGSGPDEETWDVIASGLFPIGAVIDRADLPSGAVDPATVLFSVRFRTATRQIARLRIPAVAEAFPNLWFVERPQAAATPPAHVLMAFAGPANLAGSVVDGTRGGLPVTAADQIGAVRWWPDSGYVDQVYVQPAQRRSGMGTGLILAAAALQRVRRDYEPPLRAGGQRTELGEQFTHAHPEWAGWIEPQTHVLPPMTPPLTKRR